MENVRLNSFAYGLLSLVLGWVPSLENLNTVSDLLLKFFSLASVLLIMYINLKKLRTHAPA